MNEELMEIYIEETKEHLEALDIALLSLEKNPYDQDLIDQLFRAAHTIKGSSAAMGFEKMEKLTHDMEDILHDIRGGKIEADRKVIELLFVCHDFLENSLDSITRTGSEEEINSDSILAKLHKIIEERQEEVKQPVEEKTDDKDKKEFLELDKENADRVKSYFSEGYSAYNLNISLVDDCMFKTVRVLLTFREIESIGEIISSLPRRPDEEEAKKEDFVIEENTIKAIIVSKLKKDEILEKLETLQEVKNICIETLDKEKKSKGGSSFKLVSVKDKVCTANQHKTIEDSMVNDIIGEDTHKFIEIEKEFDKDIKESIVEQIEKININAVLIDKNQDNEDIIYILFRSFHTIKGLSAFLGHLEISEISSKAEKVLDMHLKEEIQADNQLVSLILASADMILNLCKNENLIKDEEFLKKYSEHIKQYDKKEKGEYEEKKLGEILIERGKLKESDLEELLKKQKENYTDLKFGQVAVKEKKVAPKDIIESINSQEDKGKKNKGTVLESNKFMKIPVKKIDNLVDLLGEMLVFYSILERDAKEQMSIHSQFMNNLSRMSKTIKDVQGLSMSLRMVSLRPTFQKLMRIGRDTGVELEKKVDIIVSGEDTEVDRSIVEKLFDPLMHIVRNAVSHGLESSEERKQKGKNEEGKVYVDACSKRGSVYIEIKDDGKGLDTEKIYNKAKEQNLINDERDYSQDEINRFIFMPSFSTKEEANNISGRGVGMNVVETEMSKIGGRVDIINNPGQGCIFTLKIPINLAVINGTIVDVAGIRYIIPTLYIKHLLKPEEDQWVSVKGKREFINVRDEIIGLIPSKEIFDIKDEDKKSEMVVILEVEQKLKAFPVSEVLGRQEVVAKPLNEEFKDLKFASGASILGDGKVSLILDVEELFKMGENNSSS
ncbi:chemotaxis protein CheA [Herbivorax sp. ANBcel31]|uniref:chemotaxis protein CheA n=1 Tax=Herbivorax sp. ANBcel31 TaxID=3069754 RepID=UPI0027B82342|nr:chemotaxis protein CheA [Herbivorax sp. ANBcel31]MDQ2084909.1 chemotaxis protein CheA [Herbivorax sp. ANBcel31]